MNNFNNSPYFNNTGMDLIQPNQNVQQSPVYRLPNIQPQLPSTGNEFDVKTGGFKFTVKEDGSTRPTSVDIPVDRTEVIENAKRRRGRPRKETVNNDSIVRDKKDENSAKYSYKETTDMLKGTLMQIDQLASEVQQEFETVRSSRTLKNKHNVMIGLSENLGALINTKVNAIRAINDSITKSNDLDYKREKDSKALESSVNDDKYIMDMYNAFIQNPAGMNNRNILGPTAIDATLNNSGIVRLPDNQMDMQQQGYMPDTGYLSYITNMTPEQRLMSLEDNPNIKMCVIFDATTGNKTFQMMDLSTNQAVPGLPAKDPMFMEDTTIDIKNHIAKNINLGETYPLIIINEDVVKEY